MTTSLYLLLSLFCALSYADYIKYSFFASSTCSGSPIGVEDLYFSELCPTTRYKYTCINKTFFTTNFYGPDSSSCDDKPTSTSILQVQYAACSSNEQGLGRAAISECIPGAYKKPTAGAVQAFLPDSKTCTAFPQFVVSYPILDACFDGQGITGLRITCDQNGIRGRVYSDATCSGSVIEDEVTPYGCNLVNNTIGDCYSATPAAAAASSNTPIIIGGAVGGTLAVAALVGAGVYFFRMAGGTAKEAIPLL